MSQLEIFSNELLFDIFEFLSTAHLIQAFLGLNSHFNHLLYAHFQYHQLNLQSIGKQNFDIICQEHLPILVDNITSIHLSNDNETPNIYQHFYTLNRFIHLKTLSLYYINTFDIFKQFRHLSSLENLYLIDCQIYNQEKKLAETINNIWSIPKLLHCVINNIIVSLTWIYQVSIVSSTLEYLSIKKIDGDISALYYLCKSAPCLQRINIGVINWSGHHQPKIIFSSLLSLKTSFGSHAHSTKEFLKSLPNLSSLTIETNDVVMNGNEWQTFIMNYFPKLKIFRLKMNFKILVNENLITQTDKFVDSFRTHFWIEKHQWYIRCDYYLSKKHDIGILYTLPYAFDRYSYLNPSFSISTKPDQDEFYSHYHVKYVDDLQNTSIDLFKNLKLSNIRFPNIQHFEIIFPLNDDCDLSSLSFNRLTSLTVRLNNTFGYEQLQILINRANQLYLLKLISFGGSVEGLFQLTSFSIRRLDLGKAQLKHGLFFNREDCIDLINSPLGRQCEVLEIELENENDILVLIKKMFYLRVLAFRLKTHIFLFNYTVFQSEQKKLIRWLNEKLSSKCLINIDSTQRSKISIWISRETKKQSLLMYDGTSIANNRLNVRENLNKGYLYLFLFLFFIFICFSIENSFVNFILEIIFSISCRIFGYDQEKINS